MSAKALLLMRESPLQIFCANTLFRRGVIDCVYVEEGSVGEPDLWRLARRVWRDGPAGLKRRLRRDLAHFEGNARTLADYYLTRLRTRALMSRQAHHERWLGASGRRLEEGLRVIRGGSVDDPRCHQLIREGGYRLVFVFGTGLLRDGLLGRDGVAFVNLHHGWLPDFRGEGIISALAQAGVDGLGVTVHLIDRGIDTGPILAREWLIAEPGDNAYALSVKATVRGAALFQQVYERARGAPLLGTPQDPAAGRLCRSREFKSAYRMRLGAQRSLQDLTASRSTRNGSLRRLTAWSCVVGGLTVLSRRRQATRLRILMYHGVLPRVEGPAAFGDLFMDEPAFVRQLRYAARAFQVISLEEAVGRLSAGRPCPERAVVLTFDDGYRAILATVLPWLRRLRVPATVLLPTDDVGAGTCAWFDALRVLVADAARERRAIRLDGELVIDGSIISDPEAVFLAVSRRIRSQPAEAADRLVSAVQAAGRAAQVLERHPEFALAGWEEWRAALASGLVSVGSHGTTHRSLVRLGPDARREELVRSKQRIERELARPCGAVAYPYGDWDQGVAEAARSVGYACALTTDRGLNGPGADLFALRRTMVGDKGDLSLFRVRVAGAWDGLDRFRRRTDAAGR